MKNNTASVPAAFLLFSFCFRLVCLLVLRRGFSGFFFLVGWLCAFNQKVNFPGKTRAAGTPPGDTARGASPARGPGRERGGGAAGAAPGAERSRARPQSRSPNRGAPAAAARAPRPPRPLFNAPRRRARCWRDGTVPCPAPSRPGGD